MRSYEITLTRTLTDCPVYQTVDHTKPPYTKAKFKVSAESKSDLIRGEGYSVNYRALASIFKTSDFQFENFANGTLKKISIKAEDKSADVIAKAAKVAFAVASVGGSSAAAIPASISAFSKSFNTEGAAPREPVFHVKCTDATKKLLGAVIEAKAKLGTAKSELATVTGNVEKLVLTGLISSNDRKNMVEALIKLTTEISNLETAQKEYSSAVAEVTVSETISWPDNLSVGLDKFVDVSASKNSSKKLESLFQVEKEVLIAVPTNANGGTGRSLLDILNDFENKEIESGLSFVKSLEIVNHFEQSSDSNKDLAVVESTFTDYQIKQAMKNVSELHSSVLEASCIISTNADLDDNSKSSFIRKCIKPMVGAFGSFEMREKYNDCPVEAKSVQWEPCRTTNETGLVKARDGTSDQGIFIRPPETGRINICQKEESCKKGEKTHLLTGEWEPVPQLGQLRFIKFRNRMFESNALDIELTEDGELKKFGYTRKSAPAANALTAASDTVKAYRDEKKYVREELAAQRTEELEGLTQKKSLLTLQNEVTALENPPSPTPDPMKAAELEKVNAEILKIRAETALLERP